MNYLAVPFILSPPSCRSSQAIRAVLSWGPTPNTYVVHSTPARPTDAVYVYTHGASGNAAPLRILSDPAKKLKQPFGIYEGK
jgi:hypothetical protein